MGRRLSQIHAGKISNKVYQKSFSPFPILQSAIRNWITFLSTSAGAMPWTWAITGWGR